MIDAATAISAFLAVATPKQVITLANAAGTSAEHLRHVGKGRRKLSADAAQRLAHASEKFNSLALKLDQRALCDACGNCPIVDKRKAPVKVPKLLS